MSRPLWALGMVAAFATSACSSTGEPRPQLLVFVDTDLPVSAQALDDDTISRDATVDTLRVEVFLDPTERPVEDLLIQAPESDRWPVSFGIAHDGTAAPIFVRLRLFRAHFATPGTADGRATLDPMWTVAVDRLVEITPAPEGVLSVRILLSGDCRGAPVYFFDASPTTCIDAERLREDAREGVEIDADLTVRPSRVGTWRHAHEDPCLTSAPHPDAVCVPGGFFVLGDTRFVAVESDLIEDAVPLRPVVLPPFYMDRTEMTLRRLDELLSQGYRGVMPSPFGSTGVANGEHCTYRSDGSGNPGLPVNCVTHQTAADLCAFAGGALPTEAQWEYAARGRGQARLYPWGAEPPACCTASVARAACMGDGPEVVGAHVAADGCPNGDVSRDGIVDLAGSLTEPVRDKLAPLDSPCWVPPGGGGLLFDPVCDSGAIHAGERGGNWAGGFDYAATPWRAVFGGGVAAGVRCVYPATEDP